MERIAVLIESHWPGIQVTSVDQTVMAEAFRRKNVSFDEAVDAIYALAEDGERYQPRAPAILTKVAERRKALAREQRYAERLQIEQGNLAQEDGTKWAREIVQNLKRAMGA